MDPLKMYVLLKMVVFHCYVSLPEGIMKKNRPVSNLDWTFKGLPAVKAKFDGLALAFPIYKAFQDLCIWEAEGCHRITPLPTCC